MISWSPIRPKSIYFNSKAWFQKERGTSPAQDLKYTEDIQNLQFERAVWYNVCWPLTSSDPVLKDYLMVELEEGHSLLFEEQGLREAFCFWGLKAGK